MNEVARVYTLLILYSCALETETANMKNNNDISREELIYLKSYSFSAKVGATDFVLSLMFSDQEQIDKFEENARSYLSRKKGATLTKDEIAIYQKIMLGPEFAETLHDQTIKSIKKLQSDKARISQMINDANFIKGQLLLENLHAASKDRLPLLTNELNHQQFSILLWLMVADKNYAEQVKNIYDWLNSIDPKEKKQK